MIGEQQRSRWPPESHVSEQPQNYKDTRHLEDGFRRVTLRSAPQRPTLQKQNPAKKLSLSLSLPSHLPLKFPSFDSHPSSSSSLLSRLPKSMEYDTRRVLTPHSSHQSQTQPRVCYQWQCGRCYRLPCPFLHPDIPCRRRTHADDPRSFQYSAPAPLKPGGGRGRGMDSAPKGSAEKLCKFWALGKCNYGDRCRFLHSWCVGDSFTFVTALEGHQKVILSFSWLFDFFRRFLLPLSESDSLGAILVQDVSGIVLPSGSNRLYSASKDESVRIWDCQSGQCAAVANLGVEIGCMITKGPWIFVGLVNAVKAWNMETNNEISLGGPVGQVYCLEANDELLFAGSQDGSILVWKFNVGSSFEPAATLLGHNLTVVSLIVGGAQRLYSASMDNTIRVWDLGTFQCLQTLTDHTSVVMSLLCWDQFLLSCSLDQTIKVWAATESGSIEVTYTHNAEHGVLGLCGMNDAQAKPVLMCACDDNAVRVYDLPSKEEKYYPKTKYGAFSLVQTGYFLQAIEEEH
ncbi:hypothetical protein ACLOJK_005246 [Asimina triloba]